MFRKFTLGLIALLATLAFSFDALACGHEGPFVGLGYNQLFMFTNANRLNSANQKVNFGPGFGANLVLGYDIKDTRWGVQIPFEFSWLKLNRQEWVNSIQSGAEAIFHIKQWNSGIDIHLIGGAGFAYLTEGKVSDRSKSWGATASIGPGLSYFFAMSEHVSGAVALEVPLRYIRYFGNHLSSGGANAFAVPIRVSMQVGF